MASASSECYYLDTSALVKRYVKESGSEVVDGIYTKAYRGIAVIATSYWNVTEAAVVFDKYERRWVSTLGTCWKPSYASPAP